MALAGGRVGEREAAGRAGWLAAGEREPAGWWSGGGAPRTRRPRSVSSIRARGGGCAAAVVGITQHRPATARRRRRHHAARVPCVCALSDPNPAGGGRSNRRSRRALGSRGNRTCTARSFSRIQSIRQIVFVPLGVRVGSQNISQFSFDGARTRTATVCCLVILPLSNTYYPPPPSLASTH